MASLISEPPKITPVSDNDPRPFWSVMIPTYNRGTYLRKALESVLTQDPGPDQMQIEVVDNCSTEIDIVEMVRAIAGDRVSVWRQASNVGFLKNWNTCVARARGSWVHILHDDDFVLPDFYCRLRAGIERFPEVGAAYTEATVTDAEGNSTPAVDAPGQTARVKTHFYRDLGAHQLIQCAAIVVKREAYELLGAFRDDIGYVVDWEMWVRVACRYPYYYDPGSLASYRMHPQALSRDILQSGAHRSDAMRAIAVIENYLPPDERKPFVRRASEVAASRSVYLGRWHLARGSYAKAANEFMGALGCSMHWRVLARIALYSSKGIAERITGGSGGMGSRME